jgi:hypothetical protein
MQTSMTALNVEGMQLPHPSILTGSKRIPINEKAAFKLMDVPLLKTVPLNK